MSLVFLKTFTNDVSFQKRLAERVGKHASIFGESFGKGISWPTANKGIALSWKEIENIAQHR